MNQLYNGMSAALLAGALWRKSHFSNPSGNCVELAALPGDRIAIRNSRDPEGPALIYTRREIDIFVRGVKGGDFDDLLASID
ncbi:DUF397 domain-containing protein [Streptosporangium sp. NPDC000396]|uniref:DUF397 domain-containing protein n=1 Tax=Streptosporangium sp. NPDC000396 TaxID=3366185 RepID=UPI0036AE931D